MSCTVCTVQFWYCCCYSFLYFVVTFHIIFFILFLPLVFLFGWITVILTSVSSCYTVGSAISIIHAIVCLSVCMSISLSLSVCLWLCALWRTGAQDQCRGLKVVPLRTAVALPIHFFRHFCCRMYCLVTIAYCSSTTQQKPNRQCFCIWNSRGQHGHWPGNCGRVALLVVQFSELNHTSYAARSAGLLMPATLLVV